MTYKTLEDIERFVGRLIADQVAKEFVDFQRRHVQAAREAIDEIEKEKNDKAK